MGGWVGVQEGLGDFTRRQNSAQRHTHGAPSVHSPDSPPLTHLRTSRSGREVHLTAISITAEVPGPSICATAAAASAWNCPLACESVPAAFLSSTLCPQPLQERREEGCEAVGASVTPWRDGQQQRRAAQRRAAEGQGGSGGGRRAGGARPGPPFWTPAEPGSNILAVQAHMAVGTVRSSCGGLGTLVVSAVHPARMGGERE